MTLLKKISAIIIFSSFAVAFFPQGNLDNQSQTKEENFSSKQKEMKLSTSDLKILPHKEILVTESGDPIEELLGYHLYIKKLPEISSVLITDTTKDPSGKANSYAFRALEYNEINGDEIRYLDGKPLVSQGAKYSLIDSTPEKNEYFDSCFHIYIPKKIKYGYEWTRNGIVEIGKGTFINIRVFEKPYGDYSGEYRDNPFMFNFETRIRKENSVSEEKKVPEEKSAPIFLTDNYNPLANESFKEISDFMIYSEGPKDLIQKIRACFDDVTDFNNLDVVFAIDATGSMKDDLEALKVDLQAMLQELFSGAEKTRVGLLLYRDYADSFRYKGLPVKLFEFTSNIELFNKNLNSVNIRGKEGGDIPEAVFEAIYAAGTYYNWRLFGQKKIILIGDAEPHPTPRGLGKYSKEYVLETCKDRNIQINAILLPSE